MDARQQPRLVDLPPPSPGKTGWPWTGTSDPLPDTMADGTPWPSISIVTPSYNQSQFIEEAIRSVLLQGYPNLEYIIMDGGSTDGSEEIIRKYEPWFSHVHIGPDGGQAAAIAEGFCLASGDLLAWLNSDDRYRPQALARAAVFFVENPAIVFGNGDVSYVDADGQYMQRIYAVRPNRMLTASLGYHGWPQQGCFWRRIAFVACGGVDTSLRFCMDRDLFLRLLAVGPGKRIPGQPLADFRVHADAKSSTILDVAQTESQLLINRYGNAHLRQHAGFTRWLWSWWSLPTRVRARLDRMRGRA